MSTTDDIIKSPIEERRDINTLLALTLMTVLSFLIVPIFILAGYYVKAANHKGKGLPKLEDYTELGVNGVKVITSHIMVYLAIVLAALPFMMLFESGLGIPQETAETAGVLLFIPLMLFIPAIKVQIGKTGRFRDGFSKEMLSRAFTLNYVKGLLILAMVRMMFGFLFFFALITIVGILLLPFIHVYRKLVGWRFVGHYYNKDLE